MATARSGSPNSAPDQKIGQMDLREFSVASTRRHPWELARADFFCELLARRVLDHEIARILDVGAGDAFLASKLVAFVGPHTEVVCTDLHYDGSIGVRLATQLPANVRLSRDLPSSEADLILLLDVLEHVEDDRAFLRGLVRDHLAPGGDLLISVCACSCASVPFLDEPYCFLKGDLDVWVLLDVSVLSARVCHSGIARVIHLDGNSQTGAAWSIPFSSS